MTLILNIPPEIEATLRQQASAHGRETAEYAADILARAVRESSPSETQEADPDRLRHAFHEWLTEVESVQPDPNPPRLRGQEAQIEQIIVDHLRKEGTRS